MNVFIPNILLTSTKYHEFETFSHTSYFRPGGFKLFQLKYCKDRSKHHPDVPAVAAPLSPHSRTDVLEEELSPAPCLIHIYCAVVNKPRRDPTCLISLRIDKRLQTRQTAGKLPEMEVEASHGRSQTDSRMGGGGAAGPVCVCWRGSRGAAALGRKCS